MIAMSCIYVRIYLYWKEGNIMRLKSVCYVVDVPIKIYKKWSRQWLQLLLINFNILISDVIKKTSDIERCSHTEMIQPVIKTLIN